MKLNYKQGRKLPQICIKCIKRGTFGEREKDRDFKHDKKQDKKMGKDKKALPMEIQRFKN